MKILVFTFFSNELKLKLRQNLPQEEIIFADDVPEAGLTEVFKHTQIILGNPPVSLFADNPEKLKFWQLDSAGFDQYKNTVVTIPVANMGSFFAPKCAETIVAGVLCLYRRIDELIILKTKKEWNGAELRKSLQLLGDKQVLILGSGAISLAVKKILSGFGCRVTTSSQQSSRGDIHSMNEILAVLPQTDLLINTLPGTAENFVSREVFNALKTNSVYATVGRGNTTDEQALLVALQTGKLAGAVLDVTAKEPLPESHKLWQMPNVILTQHTGGGHVDEEKDKAEHYISSVKAYLQGEDIEGLIDLKKGY